jgi:hypothetical protein
MKVKSAGRSAPRIGWTIPEFSRAIDLPEHVVRRAVAKGDIRTFRFAGRARIKRGEESRIRALLGLDDADKSVI